MGKNGSIAVEELVTEEQILKQLEQALAEKKKILIEMRQEQAMYSGQPYTPGKGVGEYGPHHDKMEAELEVLNAYLRQLAKRLLEVIG